MIHSRENVGLSIAEMATALGISEGLLRIVEEGGVTHPNIALKIQKRFKLTDLQTEDLMPLCRRPHGGDYDPNRYVAAVDECTAISVKL